MEQINYHYMIKGAGGYLQCELLSCGAEVIWNEMNEPADFRQESATFPAVCM